MIYHIRMTSDDRFYVEGSEKIHEFVEGCLREIADIQEINLEGIKFYAESHIWSFIQSYGVIIKGIC